VNVQLELRKQVSLQLQALEVRNEGVAETQDEEARRAARSVEAEALREKVQHHTTVIAGLQQKLLRQDNVEAMCAKLDALTKVQDAKALLKTTIPQLVTMQLDVQKKEVQLDARARDLRDSRELTDNLRLQIAREKKKAEERVREAEQREVNASREVADLQTALAAQARADAVKTTTRDAAASLDARIAGMGARLDERSKSVDAAAPSPFMYRRLGSIREQMEKSKAAAAAAGEESTGDASAEAPELAKGEEIVEKMVDLADLAKEKEDDDDEESEDDSELESEDDSELESEDDSELESEVSEPDAAEDSEAESENDWTATGDVSWGDKKSKKSRQSIAVAQRAVTAATLAAPVKGAFDDIDSDVESVAKARPRRGAARAKRTIADIQEGIELMETEQVQDEVAPQAEGNGEEAVTHVGRFKMKEGIPASAKPVPKAPAAPPPPPGNKPASKRGNKTSVTTAKAAAEGAMAEAGVTTTREAAPAKGGRVALGKLDGNNVSSEDVGPAPMKEKGEAQRRRTLHNPSTQKMVMDIQ
jgi:hypothetical protein